MKITKAVLLQAHENTGFTQITKAVLLQAHENTGFTQRTRTQILGSIVIPDKLLH